MDETDVQTPNILESLESLRDGEREPGSGSCSDPHRLKPSVIKYRDSVAEDAARVPTETEQRGHIGTLVCAKKVSNSVTGGLHEKNVASLRCST